MSLRRLLYALPILLLTLFAWLAWRGLAPDTKIGLDQNGRVAIDFGVAGVPETFVLDRDGVVRYRLSRPLSAELIAGEIDPLLRRLAE
jgi:hypothetical protein